MLLMPILGTKTSNKYRMCLYIFNFKNSRQLVYHIFIFSLNTVLIYYAEVAQAQASNSCSAEKLYCKQDR